MKEFEHAARHWLKQKQVTSISEREVKIIEEKSSLEIKIEKPL